MSEQIIKTATASDEASISAVVVLAFSVDPAARWTWPDPQQYVRHFPDFVKALGGKAFASGSAYYVDGYAGAAMWLSPEVSPDENRLVDLLKRTGYAPVQNDVFAVFEQMARYHPLESHWYSAGLNQQSSTGDARVELNRVRRPLQGMQWIVRQLAAQGIVDENRVGVAGTSYGAESRISIQGLAIVNEGLAGLSARAAARFGLKLAGMAAARWSQSAGTLTVAGTNTLAML
jgi:hypothetical protein